MKFENSRIREIVGSALAAGSLAMLAACGPSQEASGQASPDQPTSAASSAPTKSPETDSAEACIVPKSPVSPGSRFKELNASDIQKQVDALAISYDPTAEANADNVLNALSLVTNATVDSKYASALAYESRRLASGHSADSAEQLLGMNFHGNNCLTDRQVSEVNHLYDQLVPNYGHKLGHQGGAVAKAIYDELKVGYQDFKQKYHQELNN